MEDRIAAFLKSRLTAVDVSVSNVYRIPGGASCETWALDAGWRDGAAGRVRAGDR